MVAKTQRPSQRAARRPRQSASARVVVENVNQPGSSRSVDAACYRAMRRSVLEVLPTRTPGLTYDQMSRAVRGRLPADVFPGGERAGWWLKTVQLDLEAKGTISRENTTPLRFHRGRRGSSTSHRRR